MMPSSTPSASFQVKAVGRENIATPSAANEVERGFDATFNFSKNNAHQKQTSSSARLPQLPQLPQLNQASNPNDKLQFPASMQMSSAKYSMVSSNPKGIAKYAQISLNNNHMDNPINHHEPKTTMAMMMMSSSKQQQQQPMRSYGQGNFDALASQHNASHSTQDTPEQSAKHLNSPSSQSTRFRNPVFSPPPQMAGMFDSQNEMLDSFPLNNNHHRSQAMVQTMQRKQQDDLMRVDYFPEEIAASHQQNVIGGTAEMLNSGTVNTMESSLSRGGRREFQLLKRGEVHSNSLKNLPGKRNTLNANNLENIPASEILRPYGSQVPSIDIGYSQPLNQQSQQQKQLTYQSLKVYFEQQQQQLQQQQFQRPGGFQIETSTMKKSQSIASMMSSGAQRVVQLEPIRLADLPSTLGQVPQTSSTKKFLTRKPQIKILNRVFSSKSDVKPSKNLFVKNAPSTANSHITTNSPLFTNNNNNDEFDWSQKYYNQVSHTETLQSRNRRNLPDLQTRLSPNSNFDVQNYHFNPEIGITSSNADQTLAFLNQQQDEMMMLAMRRSQQQQHQQQQQQLSSQKQQQMVDFKAFRQVANNNNNMSNNNHLISNTPFPQNFSNGNKQAY